MRAVRACRLRGACRRSGPARMFYRPPLVDAFSEFYGFDDKTTEFAIKKYRERFSTVGIFENELLPGAADMLREFKSRGKTVALATSKPQKFAERILEHFDIAKYFDVVCGCGFDGTLQTKAEVIAETMARLSNPDPARAVMIGDRKHDINGAKICGLKSIGLKLGYAEPGELEAAGADMIAKDFNELMDLIK